MNYFNLINEIEIYSKQKVNLVYKTIADFFLQNIERILQLKLEEIAINCNCSTASIIKFAKKLGFVGIKDLLPAIDRSYGYWKFHNSRKIHATSHISQTQKMTNYHYLIEENLSYLFKFNRDALLKAAKLLKNKRHVMLFGKGSNLEAINIFANYLSKLNYHVDYHYDFEVQEKWMQKFNKDSLCIFFSFSAMHKAIDSIVQEAKNKGMEIISFTSNSDSYLFKESDVAFITKNNEDILEHHTNARIAFIYLLMQIINLIK